VDVTAPMASDEVSPPAALRRTVIDQAVRARTPGRSVGVEPASPIDAYRATVDEFRQLLGTLGPADWDAPVAAYAELGWSTADLVAHLLAVERYFAGLLGADDFVPPAGTETDHIAMSLPTVGAHRGRSPDETGAAWSAAAAAATADLTTDPLADLDRRVSFHGFDYRLGSLLVVRAFELWIHGDDIRAATGRQLTLPDPSRLTLMTDLAVRAVGRMLAFRGIGTGSDERTVRIVLTGAGGGAWSIGAGRGNAADRPPPDVRIVTDAEGFCRLAAGRTPPAALLTDVTGDRKLADQVLAAAAVLAA
jgi:uncharacterized protein (TIGR03083 family)